jgi:hypothetical protein
MGFGLNPAEPWPPLEIKRGGPWRCEMPGKYLYVDGGTPLQFIQEQLKLPNLFVMSRERLMDDRRTFFNVCESCQQEAFVDYCTQMKTDVVLRDNLSSLCLGLKASEADFWE